MPAGQAVRTYGDAPVFGTIACPSGGSLEGGTGGGILRVSACKTAAFDLWHFGCGRRRVSPQVDGGGSADVAGNVDSVAIETLWVDDRAVQGCVGGSWETGANAPSEAMR